MSFYVLIKATSGSFSINSLELGDCVACVSGDHESPFGSHDCLPYVYRVLLTDAVQENVDFLFEAGELTRMARYVEFALLPDATLGAMAAGLTAEIDWLTFSAAIAER